MSLLELVQEVAAVAHQAAPQFVPALPVIALVRRAQAVVDKISKLSTSTPVTLSREDTDTVFALRSALSNSTSNSSSLKGNFWNRLLTSSEFKHNKHLGSPLLLTSSEYPHNKHFAPPMPGHTLHNATMNTPRYLASHSAPHVSKSSDLPPSEFFSRPRSHMPRFSSRRPSGRSRFNSLRSARSAPKYANRPSPSLLQRLINRGPKASYFRH